MSLGSNIGDKKRNIIRALELLEYDPFIDVVQESPMYKTEPWGNKQQEYFINCAAKIKTVMSPWKLLNILQETEKKLGKDIREHWGPRTIDIDIIFYGKKIIYEKKMIIPHPRFRFRKFVLIPLYNISSELIDPQSNKTIRELLDSSDDKSEVVMIG